MNILIICDYYPPDTAIAAVRPYMMAKYLSMLGHNVTVIRSGELSQMPDDSHPKLPQVRVLSLLGNSSVAERLERGDKVAVNKDIRRLERIPLCIRDFIQKVYKCFAAPYFVYKLSNKSNQRIALLEELLNKYMGEENIDVVFSTCGGNHIISEGQYAANFFKCKWIADFRDLLVQPLANGWLLNAFFQKIQDNTLQEADAITVVSNGLAKNLSCRQNGEKVYTIYNGYEGKDHNERSIVKTQKGKLKFCYTGRIYSARLKAFKSFVVVLKMLLDEGSIDVSNIEFIYAGPDSVLVQSELQSLSIDSILVDRGYVTRTEVMDIQYESDIFLVLSWNTVSERGVLTGKFYEGIRAHKVILSVVTGGEPDSELFELNEKYRYGFCYEDCKGEDHINAFKDFLLDSYNEKMLTNKLNYSGISELAEDFRYENLAHQLELLCNQLLLSKTDVLS